MAGHHACRPVPDKSPGSGGPSPSSAARAPVCPRKGRPAWVIRRAWRSRRCPRRRFARRRSRPASSSHGGALCASDAATRRGAARSGPQRSILEATTEPRRTVPTSRNSARSREAWLTRGRITASRRPETFGLGRSKVFRRCSKSLSPDPRRLHADVSLMRTPPTQVGPARSRASWTPLCPAAGEPDEASETPSPRRSHRILRTRLGARGIRRGRGKHPADDRRPWRGHRA